MGILDWADDSSDCSNIFTQISSFSNHPSIQIIKNTYQNSSNFKFELVSTDQVIKFIDEIDCNNNSNGDIPPKTTTTAKEEIEEPITNYINSSISTGTFLDLLKIDADIVPVFKIEYQKNESNYRPISLSLLSSKIFEKVLSQQIEDFANKILPPKL